VSYFKVNKKHKQNSVDPTHPLHNNPLWNEETDSIKKSLKYIYGHSSWIYSLKVSGFAIK
jgi:hypothetical protein